MSKPKTQAQMRDAMSHSGTATALDNIKSKNRTAKKIQKMKNQTEKAKAKAEYYAAKAQKRAAIEENRRQGNYFQRRHQEKVDLRRAENAAKKAKFEADAANKKLDPELRKLEKETESKVKIEKAKAASKIGAYTAMASGASQLGKGLIDEGNRDRDAELNNLSDNLAKIFGDGDKTKAESDGTTTGDGLTEGVE